MSIDRLSAMLLRELEGLRRQLLAYGDERQIWATPPGVANAAGTLALHLTGNLRHYIGGQLGGSGYVRDREHEFRARDIPLDQLLAGIGSARDEVASALSRLEPARLEEDFPEAVGGVRLRTGDFLLHLAVHLGYHLGQVDQHRRMVTGDRQPVPALELRAIGIDNTADAG